MKKNMTHIACHNIWIKTYFPNERIWISNGNGPMHVVGRWACINIWLIGNQRILELDIVSAKIECISKIFNKTLSKLRLMKYALTKVVLSFLFSGVILTQGDVLLKSWCRTFLFKYFSLREKMLTKSKTLVPACADVF